MQISLQLQSLQRTVFQKLWKFIKVCSWVRIRHLNFLKDLYYPVFNMPQRIVLQFFSYNSKTKAKSSMCTWQDLYGWIVNGIELPFLLQLEIFFKVLCSVRILSCCRKCINYHVSEVIRTRFLGSGKTASYIDWVREIKCNGTEIWARDSKYNCSHLSTSRYSSYLKRITQFQLTNLNF